MYFCEFIMIIIIIYYESRHADIVVMVVRSGHAAIHAGSSQTRQPKVACQSNDVI